MENQAYKRRCRLTSAVCRQRPEVQPGERLVGGALNMIAGAFDIPARAAYGVAAACAEQGDEGGRQQQQRETFG